MGAISLTWIVMVVETLPPVLVPVTVYVFNEDTTDGVPLIAPSEEAKESPDGSEGEIDHVVTVPPDVVGVDVVIAVPFVRVNEFGL